MVSACKSSVLSDYPRGTTKKNFGKLTLCSHKEKVGALYYLLLALHVKQGREIFEEAQSRQQRKYNTFPTKKGIQEWEEGNSRHKASKKRKKSAQSVAHHDDAADVVDDEPLEEDKSEETQLPAAAFPYRKDLLLGADHREKNPFDRTDESIEFVCAQLRHHGLDFLLDEDLDEHQLDLLMISSWSILRQLHGKSNQYPSNDTLRLLSTHEETRIIFSSVRNDDAVTIAPSFLEITCKSRLRRTIPSRDIDFAAIDIEEPVQYQYSLPIPSCLPKHRRKRPAISGNGYTGAVLSDSDTYRAYIEYMLCYHAWCHYSHQLPRELQEDYDLIDFASQMVVQYFDSILYRGDDSVDADTCKIHTQLHNA